MLYASFSAVQYTVHVSYFVLQSAAMEETVIWEQHTVTLHRVSVYNFKSTHPFLLFCLLFVFLWHPEDALLLSVFSNFPPIPLPIHLFFFLCTERASCSSRMCSTETIVKKPRWQETRLRKTKINIYFLTTSFHFLPVGSIVFFLTQLQRMRCLIVWLCVLFVLCYMCSWYCINLLTSATKVGTNHRLPPLAQWDLSA